MMTNDLTIRPADESDIPDIDAILLRAYPKLLSKDYDADTLAVALPMMAVTRPALLAEGTYFVAELDGEIVGAGGWTRAVPGQDVIIPNRGNIRRLIVDDRRQRQGIAAALMDASHQSAQAAGMAEMYVLSTRTAVPFYAAQGYQTIREIDVPLGQAGVVFPSIEMSRSLSVAM